MCEILEAIVLLYVGGIAFLWVLVGVFSVFRVFSRD
jgi:hypothetical protein